MAKSPLEALRKEKVFPDEEVAEAAMLARNIEGETEGVAARYSNIAFIGCIDKEGRQGHRAPSAELRRPLERLPSSTR